MSILKSIGAIIAGMLVIVLLSVCTDFILQKIGVFPPSYEKASGTPLLLLAFAYRCIYGVAGGYVTALLAPNRPMRHAIILGIIGTAISIIGAVVGWKLSAHWYPIALVVTALPTTWLGGKLKTK
jgi:hypothetical protein